MEFNVVGSDRASGTQCTVVVEADSVEDAAQVARRQLSEVAAVAARRSAQPQDAQPRATDQGPHTAPESRAGAILCKPVAVLLALAAPAALLAPTVTTIAGALLTLSLATMALVPAARPAIGRSLGIRRRQPIRGALKLAFHTVYGPCLLALGYVGAQMHEQALLAQGEELVRDEVAIQRKVEATQKVGGMLKEARTKLEQGDVQRGTELAREAAKIVLASNVKEARQLDRAIARAHDPKHILSLLTSMPEADFESLRTGQAYPRSMDFGFVALNKIAHRSADDQMDEATAIRLQRAAKIKADQEGRRREAEQQAVAAREKAEAEAARITAEEAARKRGLQTMLDAYLAALKGTRLVDTVRIQRADPHWLATVTVTNLWHGRARQLRLQDAQTLWEHWARIASPADQDRARIKIVDLRGNEVGGSRIWGGSLIWVLD